jgi:DNA-binding MarR family transcriptional regulator
MSVVQSDGAKVDLSAKQLLVDCMLGHERVIGYRRWGMAQLYYRAGLSQQEIAEIFGINRQMVTYELKKAFRIAAAQLGRRGCGGGRGGAFE